jgi:hypothetical protein
MYDDDIYFEKENLLTNFGTSELKTYKKAIEIYGDDTLYIDDVAYDSWGNRLNGDYALRTKEYKDRSEFWELFRSLRNS